jgi:hypothetical protein
MEISERRTIRRRLTGIAVLVLGFTFVATLAPATAVGGGLYKKDLYFSGGYERQVDSRTCVAASTAMMLNFIARKDLGLNQLYILKWAQPRDALNDSRQRGTDPLGWSRALTTFSTRAGQGSFLYSWEARTSEYSALKRAAKQIAVTNKPVGLLVWNGRHAMVMTGFEASSDPRKGDFKLVNVWISDPYGSSHKRYAAAESPLNKYLELDATPDYDTVWYGKYVTVVPQD